MSCNLSPYGSYLTPEDCTKREAVCGGLWRCARKLDNGQFEVDPVTGDPVMPGNPILASIIDGGAYGSPEECKCYTCNVDTQGETATCEVTDGVQGDHSDNTCDQKCNFGYSCHEDTLVWEENGQLPADAQCVYVADGTGQPRLATSDEIASGVPTSSFPNFKGFTCSPTSNAPVTVPDGELGIRREDESCRYTCDNGTKMLSEDASVSEPPLDLKCFKCVGDETPVPVASGKDGDVDDAGDVCRYTCEDGSKVYMHDGETYDSLNCYRCAGGEDTPEAISGTTRGNHPDTGTCKYTCLKHGGDEVRKVYAPKTGIPGSELKCYECSYDADDRSKPIRVDGVDGHLDTSDHTCLYTCKTQTDDEVSSSPVYSADGTDRDLVCYTCDPNAGDPSEPIPIDGINGNYDKDEYGKCQYQCKDGAKVPLQTHNKDYHASVDDLWCYKCDGGPKPVPYDITYGPTKHSLTAAESPETECKYWCGSFDTNFARGESVSPDKRDTIGDDEWVSNKDDVVCYSCQTEDIGTSCQPVEHGLGDYKYSRDCSTATQCGWGYGCNDNACVKDRHSKQTLHECKMNSEDKCGWGYMCNGGGKYACVDGTACSPVPQEKCNDGTHTCFDSEKACINTSTCTTGTCGVMFPGRWSISRATNGISLIDSSRNAGPDYSLFKKPERDEDETMWYHSQKTLGGDPLVSIGVQDRKDQDGNRHINVKARGRVSWTARDEQYWFIHWDGVGTYDAPRSFQVGFWTPDDPGYHDCQVFDGLELSRLASNSKTCIHRSPNKTSSTDDTILFLALNPSSVCGLDDGVNVSRGDVNASPYKGTIAGVSCVCKSGSSISPGDQHCSSPDLGR